MNNASQDSRRPGSAADHGLQDAVRCPPHTDRLGEQIRLWPRTV